MNEITTSWMKKKHEELIRLDEEGNEEELKAFLESLYSQITPSNLDFGIVAESPREKAARQVAMLKYGIEIRYTSLFNELKVSTLVTILSVWLEKYESPFPTGRNRSTDEWILRNLQWVSDKKVKQIETQLLDKSKVPIDPSLPFIGYKSYWNDPEMLDYLSIFLEKADIKRTSRIFLARSQALGVKDELKKETDDQVQKIVSDETNKFSKEITKRIDSSLDDLDKKLNTGLKEAKENEQRMTRNFVQIIGIFAAIIAFVVTIVPTATRLGGLSIPISLLGLALVTSGIIILLAMIFGRKVPKKKGKGTRTPGGLIIGISIISTLFVGWILFTSWLAVKHPKTLNPLAEEPQSGQPLTEEKADTRKVILPDIEE